MHKDFRNSTFTLYSSSCRIFRSKEHIARLMAKALLISNELKVILYERSSMHHAQKYPILCMRTLPSASPLTTRNSQTHIPPPLLWLFLRTRFRHVATSDRRPSHLTPHRAPSSTLLSSYTLCIINTNNPPSHSIPPSRLTTPDARAVISRRHFVHVQGDSRKCPFPEAPKKGKELQRL